MSNKNQMKKIVKSYLKPIDSLFFLHDLFLIVQIPLNRANEKKQESEDGENDVIQGDM